MMQKLFEYEAKYDSKGKLTERRLSVGASLVYALVIVILALAGKALPTILPQLLDSAVTAITVKK